MRVSEPVPRLRRPGPHGGCFPPGQALFLGPALRVLASWQYRPRQRLTTGVRNDEGGSEFPPHVAEALSFFLKLVESHPEAVLHVWPRHDPPVVILTDAMQEGTCAGLGFVASYPSLIPGGAAVVEFGGQLVPNNLVLEHAEYGNPLRCITMLEALATLAVVEGEQGERLRGRYCWLFIDNTASLWGLMKAYSASASVARSELGAKIWMSWCPAKFNLADFPSRLELADRVRCATSAVWVGLRVPLGLRAAAFVGEGSKPDAANAEWGGKRPRG
ncbi:hypothetical protein T492DRAFT_967515 [Pavlovales sp. CCMP2436]|nr:hypothetical protein T492DRAFT_967515 [Pavlovales sp. CCMP2436]